MSMELKYRVEVVPGISNELGESPVWSVTEHALYWVDITQARIHRWIPETGRHQSWSMPCPVGSIGLRSGGGLVVALKTGFHLLDTTSGVLRFLHDPEPDRPGNRMNDGKVSPEGRFWAGSVAARTNQSAGAAMYRLDADGSCHCMVKGLWASNGLAWSPDGRRLYHSDSRAGTVWWHEYDPRTGDIGEQRHFVTLPPAWGRPDGAAMDREGCYWSAGVSAGRINRFGPDGELVGFIRVPLTHPTMPCFGGPDLRTLYITSLRHRLTVEQLRQAPLSGSLLKIELDIQGTTTGLYGG